MVVSHMDNLKLPSKEDAIGNLGNSVAVSTLRLVDYLKSVGGSLYNFFTKYKSIYS